MTQTTPGRRAATPSGSRWQRAKKRYGVLPLVVVALTLTATGVGLTTTTTGSPDAGIFTGKGPLANPLFGAAEGNTLRGDDAADRGDITIDLDGDGQPDTRLDADGDGTITDADPTLAELATQRDAIANTVAPDPDKTNTSEVILTPAGPEWWKLVTSLAPDLRLGQAPAPEGNYYAVTVQQNTTALKGSPKMYAALHVAFPDEDAALAWTEANAATAEALQWQFPTLRDTVLTTAPVAANPNDQPLPKAPAATIKPQAAVWSADLGRFYALQAQDSPYRENVAGFYTNLGFRSGVHWNAVATNPEGPWIGRLDNYTTASIDTDAAIAALADSVSYTCDATGESCTESDEGLIDAANAMAWTTPDGRIGRHDALLPTQAPRNAVVTFGYQPGVLAGIFNGTRSTFTGPYGYTNGWITPDGTMTRFLVPGAAPDVVTQTPTS